MISSNTHCAATASAADRETHERGFSLVEVMVALIVIAVGLLGIARMQAMALSSTTNARMQSLAAIEAASLASAMHANRAYWNTITPPAAITVDITGVTSASNPELTAAVNCTFGATNTAAPCSPPQLAAADLQTWGTGLTTIVPNSSATITCQNVMATLSCQILIVWTESAVAINKQQTAAPAAFQRSQYTLFVQP